MALFIIVSSSSLLPMPKDIDSPKQCTFARSLSASRAIVQKPAPTGWPKSREPRRLCSVSSVKITKSLFSVMIYFSLMFLIAVTAFVYVATRHRQLTKSTHVRIFYFINQRITTLCTIFCSLCLYITATSTVFFCFHIKLVKNLYE